MNQSRLWEILHDSCLMFRKGAAVEGDPALVEAVKGLKDGVAPDNFPGGSVHIYAMPHESEAPDALEKVDCHFITVGVSREKAESHKAELLRILADYPHPDRLAAGPSYIEVGAEIGSQDAALQLFALGKVLGLWDIVTPKLLGFYGREADALAGRGYLMTTGLNSLTAT